MNTALWQKLINLSDSQFANASLICSNGKLKTHLVILASLASRTMQESMKLLFQHHGDVTLILPDFEVEELGDFFQGLASSFPTEEGEKKLERFQPILKSLGLFRYECEIGLKKSSSRATKDRHVRLNHHESRLCDVCEFSCRDLAELKIHRRIHTEDSAFPQKSELNQHWKSLLKEKPTDQRLFPCDQCGKRLKTSYSLKTHQKLHEVDRQPGFECLVCHKSFSQKSHLTVHQRLHSGTKLFMCPVCGKKFSVGSNLNQHMRLLHSKTGSDVGAFLSETTNDNVEKVSKLHSCAVCQKSFKHESRLEKHFLKHACDGERSFFCSDCGKSYSTKSAFNDHHARIHLGLKRSHSCLHCEKKYANRSDLKVHLLSHSGQQKNPLICELCDKTFKAKRHLEDHVRTHTGLKPFQCHNCSKCFTAAGGLSLHFKRNDICRLTSGPGAFSLSKSNFISEIEESLISHIQN